MSVKSLEELKAFLEARIAEDEAVANEPHHRNWDLYPYWFRPNGEDPTEGSVIAADRVPDGALSGLIRYITGPEEIDLADATHMARHDPARILREVAAKRALVASHDIGRDPCEAHDAMYESVPCDVILHLAAIYSDHPDYQKEWAL